jgi:hypothetical protein
MGAGERRNVEGREVVLAFYSSFWGFFSHPAYSQATYLQIYSPF